MQALSTDMDHTTRILVVDDDPDLRKLIGDFLAGHGYLVEVAENAAVMRAAIGRQRPDLVILDVMMPGEDGLSAARRLVTEGGPPVIMLSALGSDTDRIIGLEVGADDYLPKPFDVNELLARVRALLRRASGRAPTAPPRLAFAGFWVRFDTGQALTNEGEVSLSDKELRLMEVFSANENRALTRTDLLEEVWGMDQFPTDRTVDNFILRLRKLFEPDPENPVHIVTLRGRGYLFRSAP